MGNNRVQPITKAQETHKENIRKSLEHRLEVARANGDDKLVRQLEAEMEHYT